MSADRDMEAKVRTALKAVIDPEVGLNIVDMGLIYRIDVEDGQLAIDMTMTTPSCPMTEYLYDQVADAAWRAYPDARNVDVQLVWEPPWHAGMIAEESRGFLGWAT